MAVFEAFRLMTRGWRPYVERPVPADEITRAMTEASIPAFGFYFLVVIATAIATFGLLANSAPTIIGAMIIAPLMSPIMSLSFGVVAFDWRMIARSALSVSCG